MIDWDHAARLYEWTDRYATAPPRAGRVGAVRAGKTVILPVTGVLDRPDYASIAHRARSLSDDKETERVVLYVNSPGGLVSGAPEAAQAIADLADAKPVTALVDGLGTSAAYWLASQAGEIVASPSSEVGSIGVFAIHADYSRMHSNAGIEVSLIKAGRYKALGNPFQPLDDEARSIIQRSIDDTYREFVAAVARGRGVPVETIEEEYGQGRVLSAREALEAGLVDRLESADLFVRRLTTGDERPRARTQRRRALGLRLALIRSMTGDAS